MTCAEYTEAEYQTWLKLVDKLVAWMASEAVQGRALGTDDLQRHPWMSAIQVGLSQMSGSTLDRARSDMESAISAYAEIFAPQSTHLPN